MVCRRRLAAGVIAMTLAAWWPPAFGQQVATWAELAIDGVEAYQLGKLEFAADRFGQALAVSRGFGATDQRLTNSLINLARTYRGLERYADAVPLYREVIARQELAHGLDDPDLALSLEALGGLYAAEKQWTEAEPVLRRSLRILERTVGSEHPYTAIVVADLGDVALGTGRYVEAVGLFARVVTIRRTYFGRNHRSLGAPLTREAIALRALNRDADARQVLEEAWAIWSGVAAPAAEAALTLRNLVDLDRREGRYEEAAQLGRHLVARRADELGPTTPAFANELDDFATSLRLAGDLGQAQLMAQWAEAIRRAPPPATASR